MKLLVSSLVVALAMPGLQACVGMAMTIDAPMAAHHAGGDDRCAESVSAAPAHDGPMSDEDCCALERTPDRRTPAASPPADTAVGQLEPVSGPSVWAPADACGRRIDAGPPLLSTVARHLLLSVFLI